MVQTSILLCPSGEEQRFETKLCASCKLDVSLLYFNALDSYQHDWNITVGNVNSTAVDVSWLPLNTKSANSTDIYGYVAVSLRYGTGDILLLNIRNASSLNTVVNGMRPYEKYQIKVVGLVKDRVTGVITVKTSESTEIRTLGGGE